MIMSEKVDDVHKKVPLEPRSKERSPESAPRRALRDIVDHVEKIVKVECAR